MFQNLTVDDETGEQNGRQQNGKNLPLNVLELARKKLFTELNSQF